MIYIRADANRDIGMGHVMRCLSVADALRDQGREAAFIVADAGVEALIRGRGYRVIVLRSDYRDMDSELTKWPEENPGLILVDSYSVTASYLKALRGKYDCRLAYMDDVAAFAYPVDILINYNAFGDEIDYAGLYQRAGGDCPKLLLGPGYAPLRTSFRGIPVRTQRKDVRDVLISTGGADTLHLALQFVRSRPDDYTYHILVGAMNPDREEIRRAASANIVVHENVEDMRALIERCDIAVSAAGSTLYEICACGVPLVTYVVADNQIKGAEAFEKLGLAVNCGDMRGRDRSAAVLLDALRGLANDYEERRRMGMAMQKRIDGQGADNIVLGIQSLSD